MKYKLKRTETDIKRQIKDYLSYFPDIFYFSLVAGLGSLRGLPDMIVVKDGEVFFVEVKTPTGVQSQAQIEFESKLRYVGGKYLLVRSLEEFILKINEKTKKTVR